MKKMIVILSLLVLLFAVTAVYAETGDAASVTQAGAAQSQIELSVGADDPFADWNCPTAVFQLPTKCIYP